MKFFLKTFKLTYFFYSFSKSSLIKNFFNLNFFFLKSSFFFFFYKSFYFFSDYNLKNSFKYKCNYFSLFFSFKKHGFFLKLQKFFLYSLNLFFFCLNSVTFFKSLQNFYNDFLTIKLFFNSNLNVYNTSNFLFWFINSLGLNFSLKLIKKSNKKKKLKKFFSDRKYLYKTKILYLLKKRKISYFGKIFFLNSLTLKNKNFKHRIFYILLDCILNKKNSKILKFKKNVYKSVIKFLIKV